MEKYTTRLAILAKIFVIFNSISIFVRPFWNLILANMQETSELYFV